MKEQEGEKKILSAIRMTNCFTVIPVLATGELPDGRVVTESEPVLLYPPLSIHAVFSFHCEEPAEIEFAIGIRRPNGDRPARAPSPKKLTLGAGAEGLTMHTTVTLKNTTEAGDYWIDIYVDQELVNRLPLRLTHGEPVHSLHAERSSATSPAQQK